MPTKKRITVPGTLAHIMARGISGKPVFKDNEDRQYFLDLFAEEINKTGYICYAWALMSTHYHFVVRCSEKPLHMLMRNLNSKYAKYLNRKNGERGYVFQDRFKSIISQDQNYLEELIRYVHLNPLRAGICKTIKSLDTYRWCGHGVLLGNFNASFQMTDSVLRHFDSNKTAAKERYREFVCKGINIIKDDWIIESVRKSNKGIVKKNNPDCWVIGDREFVCSVIQKNEENIRLSRSIRENWTLDKVILKVAKMHGVNEKEILTRSRLTKGSDVRKKFAFISCRLLGFSLSEVAKYLDVSGPCVSWAVKKGEELVDKEEISYFTILPPG